MTSRDDGRAAEDAAAEFLKARGYKIVQRNLVTRFGEVDILAVEDDEVVFVEVKSRTSDEWGYPEDRIDRRKQATLRRIADFYLARRGLPDAPHRFDIVALVRKPDDSGWDIELFENAF